MRRSSFVRTMGILAVAAASSPLCAQGFIDEQRCPGADGNGGGGNDRFTYQSWVDDAKDGRNFRRCIQNEAKKPIWTHWRGLLSATWIPVGQRLYGTTLIATRDVQNSQTDLWWGDAKSERLQPEAKCYRGEDPCREKRAATSDPNRVAGLSLLPVAFDATSQIEATARSKQDFVVRTYQEFYLPRNPAAPSENLGKLGLVVASRLSQGNVSYTLSVVVSRPISEWNGDGVAFRLASTDGAVMRALALESVRPTIAALRDLARSSLPVSPLVNTPATKPEKLLARSVSIDVLGANGAVVASVPVSILSP
jgi:hypothetical protein